MEEGRKSALKPGEITEGPSLYISLESQMQYFNTTGQLTKSGRKKGKPNSMHDHHSLYYGKWFSR
jgi:hypothetical protein